MERGDTAIDEKILHLLNVEIETLTRAQHKNVVNLIEYNDRAILTKKDKSQMEVIMIVLELAPGGELFDIIAGTGGFGE